MVEINSWQTFDRFVRITCLTGFISIAYRMKLWFADVFVPQLRLIANKFLHERDALGVL